MAAARTRKKPTSVKMASTVLRHLRLSVKPPDLNTRDDKEHKKYLISVRTSGEKWGIRRSFVEFSKLRDYILLKLLPHQRSNSLIRKLKNEDFPTQADANSDESTGDCARMFKKFLNMLLELVKDDEDSIEQQSALKSTIKVLFKFLKMDPKTFKGPKRHSLADKKKAPRTYHRSTENDAATASSKQQQSPKPPRRATEKLVKDNSNGGDELIVEMAEREFGKVLNDEQVGLVMRFLDKLIKNAIFSKPGCYRVDPDKNTLLFDSEAFYHEVRETFYDIPENLERLFYRQSLGQWRIPPRMQRYVKLRWDEHQQQHAVKDESSGSDSEEYNVLVDRKKKAIGGGYTEDQIGELEQMNADGVAGKDQLKRLRKQLIDESRLRQISSSSSSSSYSSSSYESDSSSSGDSDSSSDHEKSFQL